MTTAISPPAPAHTKRTWSRAEFQIAFNAAYVHAGTDSPKRKGVISGVFGIHKDSKTWTITHLPTGLRISDSADALGAAKLIADRLEPLADWDHMNKEAFFSLDSLVRDQIRAIARGE